MAKQQKEMAQVPDLSQFDYTKLSGEAYRKYIAIAGEIVVENGRPRYATELVLNDKYDFEVWKATAITEYEFDRKTGVSHQVVAGIQLNGAQPIMKTRISAKNAIDMNAYVSSNAQEHGNSKFYLLAK